MADTEKKTGIWDKVGVALLALGLLAVAAWAGYRLGLRAMERGGAGTRTVTVRDTVWREVHDTALVEVERRVVRHDTVSLAAVAPVISKTETAGTAGTAEDYSAVDTVFVEVPIETRVFEGENYRITAQGYMVTLTDVRILYPEISVRETVTRTRTRHWSFGLGVQAGYGYTLHGFSPYAGLGASFGYVF